MNKKLTLALAALSLSAATASAQTIKVAKDYDVQITGSLQTDFLVPQEDNKIGTGTYDDKVLNNTYAEVHALSKYVDAGVRLEYLEHPLPGFDKDFKGWGVPFYYIKGKMKNAELTLGNFYGSSARASSSAHTRSARWASTTRCSAVASWCVRSRACRQRR